MFCFQLLGAKKLVGHPNACVKCQHAPPETCGLISNDQTIVATGAGGGNPVWWCLSAARSGGTGLQSAEASPSRRPIYPLPRPRSPLPDPVASAGRRARPGPRRPRPMHPLRQTACVNRAARKFRPFARPWQARSSKSNSIGLDPANQKKPPASAHKPAAQCNSMRLLESVHPSNCELQRTNFGSSMARSCAAWVQHCNRTSALPVASQPGSLESLFGFCGAHKAKAIEGTAMFETIRRLFFGSVRAKAPL